MDSPAVSTVTERSRRGLAQGRRPPGDPDAVTAQAIATSLSERDFTDMEDDKVVLDRQQVWAGSRDNPVQLEEVQAWLLQASNSYNRARVRFDPWQAALLAQGLAANGVKVEEVVFDPARNGRRALTLHTLLRDQRLAIYEDADLIDELMNVQLRETSPGVYRIDHQSGRHDDRVISLRLMRRMARLPAAAKEDRPARVRQSHQQRQQGILATIKIQATLNRLLADDPSRQLPNMSQPRPGQLTRFHRPTPSPRLVPLRPAA